MGQQPPQASGEGGKVGLPLPPGGWEGQMVDILGQSPITEPDVAPPDLPPLSEPASTGDSRSTAKRPGKQRDPYEASLAVTRATVTPGTWQRCSAWWQAVDDRDPEFGVGMDYGRRLSIYLNHATYEHALADLQQVSCATCGAQVPIRDAEERQYDWAEMHAVDLRELQRLAAREISDQAARGQTDTILRCLADEKDPTKHLQLVRKIREELS